MTDFVRDLLVARRAVGLTEFVFHSMSRSGHIEMPRHYLTQVFKATGIQVTVHDLRRTFATTAEASDISQTALKALINHGIGSDVTSGYIQIVTERLREPAQKVTDRLRELCGVYSEQGVVRLKG